MIGNGGQDTTRLVRQLVHIVHEIFVESAPTRQLVETTVVIAFARLFTAAVVGKVGVDIVEEVVLPVGLPVGDHDVGQHLVQPIDVGGKAHVAAMYEGGMQVARQINSVKSPCVLEKVGMVPLILVNQGTHVAFAVGLTVNGRRVGREVHLVH